ncbi:hypothetical protein ACFWGR_23615 [Streptomyces sp. NPDC060311]|uniref:hypothetical protein n=1 Tax=Streptomyces sp. NPDC060311 TaxID=3347096 RepID=UPI00365D6F4A
MRFISHRVISASWKSSVSPEAPAASPALRCGRRWPACSRCPRGLGTGILAGQRSPDSAAVILDDQLNRVFRPVDAAG